MALYEDSGIGRERVLIKVASTWEGIQAARELEAEGITRDLVRLVQQARRDAGLQVSDRISLTLGVPESIRRQVVAFQHLLTDATLATSLTWAAGEPNADLDGEPVHISVAVAG